MSQQRLLLDVMCGGLRSYLRMCGHDTVYALDRDVEADDELRHIARREHRTLVTRDRQLAERVEGAIALTARDTREQLRTLAGAGIDLTLTDPQRCSTCNGPLDRAPPPASDAVPDDRPLWRCRQCGQYFWKGSHWDRVQRTLEQL